MKKQQQANKPTLPYSSPSVWLIYVPEMQVVALPLAATVARRAIPVLAWTVAGGQQSGREAAGEDLVLVGPDASVM